MHLKRVRVPNFRVLKDVDITFEPDLVPRIYPLGSANGGGKSTLLQLIFTLLHCCGDENRISYLQNMLDGFDIEDDSGHRDLATINLIVDGQDLELKFFLSDQKYIDNNFEHDLTKDIDIPDLLSEGINNLSDEQAILLKSINDIILTQKQLDYLSTKYINNFEKLKSSAIGKTQFEFRLELLFQVITDELIPIIDSYINTCAKSNLLQKYKSEAEEYLGQITLINIESSSFKILKNEVKKAIDKAKVMVMQSYRDIVNLIKATLNTEFLYGDNEESRVFTISKKNKTTSLSEVSLICSFTIIDNIATDKSSLTTLIAEKVFLAAPATQVFHFLAKSDRLLLFRTRENRSDNINYSSKIDAAKSDLQGFFPYDTVSADFLIETLESAINHDIQQIAFTSNYGNSYPKLVAQLERAISNQKVNVDLKSGRITFTKTDARGNTIQLYPEDLSHGELKRLSLYVWLKYNNIEDAIVLMDEIEIALHPDWQYGMINDLQTWAPNNQYILATHSYEMCQALTPAHVKEIEPKLLKQK
ncbi:MAG: AAA family ATPase [Waterburya sp.]